MGDPINPYAAPRSFEDQPEPAGYARDLQDATNGVRFANVAIDTVVAGVIAFTLGLLLTAVLGSEAALLGLLLRPCYYIFFESVFQATPGKMITGTRVIAEWGDKPSVGQIIKRTLIRFVPFEPFSFLGSTAGWHDRWSKTRVVRKVAM
jgi:uncharacterized RDD family membrane protein YckC